MEDNIKQFKGTLDSLEVRINSLEIEVFRGHGGGPNGGFGAKLEDTNNRLDALKTGTADKFENIKNTIDEVIKIVAELRGKIEHPRNQVIRKTEKQSVPRTRRQGQKLKKGA